MSDWCLYLLQDTISRKHSFHPIKVLSYCVLFRGAFMDTFSTSPTNLELLDSCEYVAVVPQEKKTFYFDKPASTSAWNEIDPVAALLDFNWPREFAAPKPDWFSLVEKRGLDIPPTTSGKQRSLNKAVVANALLIGHAAKTLLRRSRVVFDVLEA